MNAEDALTGCARAAEQAGKAADGLAQVLRAAADGLGEPLRLAVAGQIKRGKSTLVNALLGERIALTGQLEVTFTVSELYYARERRVTVRRRDGSSRTLPAEAFGEMTARDESRAALLADVERVEHGLPNPLLRAFRLADTPGLGSVHGVDSQNTHDFLGISSFAGEEDRKAFEAALAASGRTARDVHDDSVNEIRRADAVLYLFARGLHDQDRLGVREFLGNAGDDRTPLNTFGVLSRCDLQWPPSQDYDDDCDPLTWDPMAESAKIAEKNLERPSVRSVFFTIVPIAGLLGEGAQLLTGDELDVLADLAKAPPRVLVNRLTDTGVFATAEQLRGIDVPADLRRALIARIGSWGVHLACGFLRDGANEEQLRAALVEASGVGRLRDLVGRHFGNRNSLIKLDHGLRSVEGALAGLRRDAVNGGPAVPPVAAEVAERLERLRARTAGFAELAVLSAYYRDELRLSPAETDELLRITGEYGTSLPSRLGLPQDAAPHELRAAALARVHRWARREQDPTLDRPSLQAVRAVRRGCERLLHAVPESAASREEGA
ncbi:dynamin family protein [Streptomyces sp. NBC_01275]|uniref:dynamin family protein n=1 Tax=Streptomyces sp. NBC_01275 TaxID=2903807 RepID=UPI0022581190|nr:dynamin family protein [Streptomyces sp. NBC_01275]MCX4762007.1 dynamin family protein [Streptomyces sp. NBC_01275]